MSGCRSRFARMRCPIFGAAGNAGVWALRVDRGRVIPLRRRNIWRGSRKSRRVSPGRDTGREVGGSPSGSRASYPKPRDVNRVQVISRLRNIAVYLGGGGVVWSVMARHRITWYVLVGVGLWWRLTVILAVAILMRVLRHVGGSRKDLSLDLAHFDDRKGGVDCSRGKIPGQGGIP